MDLFVGVTDGDWYELLANEPGLDEVNFWQPGGNHQFRALSPGELFLFKLHSPLNFKERAPTRSRCAPPTD